MAGGDGRKLPLNYQLPEGEREMEEMKAASNLSNGRGRWEKTPSSTINFLRGRGKWRRWKQLLTFQMPGGDGRKNPLDYQFPRRLEEANLNCQLPDGERIGEGLEVAA
jgi:hypothetical protein